MREFVAFNKLKRAVEFSNSREGYFVFSFEISEGGVRRYLVASKRSFWSSYKEDKSKNCYEVIVSGHLVTTGGS